MSYTEMAKQNMENAAIAEAARSAEQQRLVADAQLFGEQTGADSARGEIDMLLSRLHAAERYNDTPQGLAGLLTSYTDPAGIA